MSRNRTPEYIAVSPVQLLLLNVFRVAAQEVNGGPIVIQEEKHDTSRPVREMPLVAPRAGVHAEELPVRRPMPPHKSPRLSAV